MEKLVKRYKYDNGVFSIRSGPHAGIGVDQNKIIAELLQVGIQYDKIPQKLDELARFCQSKSNQDSEVNITEEIEIILKEQDFVKDFKYLRINDDYFTYYFKGKRAYHIQVGYPSTKEWVNIFLKYKNEDIVDLKKRLAPLISPKSPYSMSLEDAAYVLANSLDFSKRMDLKEDLLGDIKPVTLATSEEISLYKVDYEKIDNPVLNPHMQEFLSRVSDHEYLCAITWIMFNGQKSPYIVYLYGTGGEGKSSFLNVLANNVGTVAAFQSYNQFSNYNMYGKAMILLTENTNVFLLQDQVVKQLTGNSKVHCEEKHTKGSFTSNLPGTLYADANKMLKLKGEEAEFRRLRIFKVKKPKYIAQLDMKTYEACLNEDFNSFLNYCRICFEKVGSSNGWLVPASETQAADFKALTDKGFIHQSEQILHKMFRDLNLEYADKGVMDSNMFWSSFYKLPEAQKDKFLADNIKDYLFLHKQVVEIGTQMQGIQQKSSDRTSFELPTTM